MIQLEQINKTYDQHGKAFQALKNIRLHITRGEIFGILGKSGAGKSTLLRCINLLEKPTSGSIRVNGTELTTLMPEQLRTQRHKIGMIFQQFNLLASRTVFENIALPLEIIHTPKAVIQQKVDELIELVGLTYRQHHYPSQLSGGQKQRVAIARALATNPHVLLSDEATSALDPESTGEILKLLQTINQKLQLTILLITHELGVVKQICDRVGIMHEGELLEHDTTLNVLAHPHTPIARQFVQNAFQLLIDRTSLSEAAISPPPGMRTLILQLTFIGETCNIPLVATLMKKFDLTVNVRQAHITPLKNAKLGFTICELTGKTPILDEALQYAQSTSVKIEVLYDSNT